MKIPSISSLLLFFASPISPSPLRLELPVAVHCLGISCSAAAALVNRISPAKMNCSSKSHRLSFLVIPLFYPSFCVELCYWYISCCSTVSGEIPEEPVVSRNSGLLFEKRLIERHILVCSLFLPLPFDSFLHTFLGFFFPCVCFTLRNVKVGFSSVLYSCVFHIFLAHGIIFPGTSGSKGFLIHFFLHF